MNAREKKIYSFNQITKVMKRIKTAIVKTRALSLKPLSFLGFLKESLLNHSLSILVTRKKDPNYSRTQLSNISFYSNGVTSGVHSFIGDISLLCSISL
jgi:hypothetical protein